MQPFVNLQLKNYLHLIKARYVFKKQVIYMLTQVETIKKQGQMSLFAIKFHYNNKIYKLKAELFNRLEYEI